MARQQLQTQGARLPHGMARELIVDAAEVLFSEANLETVSFRDLARKAGVSLSAIHYHFGSKEGVLAEIFARHAAHLVERRVELLRAIPRSEDGALPLERIIDAFIRPAFETTRGDRNDLFNRLLARLSIEPSDVVREIISEAFDENDLLFIEEIRRAVAGLSRDDAHWRFHFLVGSMIYAMSGSGQLSGLSGGLCDVSNTDVAMAKMTSAFVALFEAP